VKMKTLALVAAAGLGLIGAPSVFACSILAWNGGPTGTPVAGRPSDTPTPTARYSGQCGLRSTATAQFVTDNTPTAEQTFRARFYVYTGLASGSAVVYEALNAATPPLRQIAVTYNRDAGNLSFATTGPTPQTIPVVPDRWYSVELNWSRAATNMGVTVQGAAATTPVTATVAGVGATDQIDTARLGWVSGTGVGSINADAYESRRTNSIGRLCRGDANNDNVLGIADRVQITTEAGGGALAAGQPDVNEDGVIAIADRVIITTRIGNSDTCP
jgi:hypothetical protein